MRIRKAHPSILVTENMDREEWLRYLLEKSDLFKIFEAELMQGDGIEIRIEKKGISDYTLFLEIYNSDESITEN